MLDVRPEQTEPVTLSAGSFLFRQVDLTADPARLVRLATEVEAVDHAGETVTEQQIRNDLASPGYDLARDGWVVEEPGWPDRLIAEGFAYRIPNTARAVMDGRVHPAWRGRALGRTLLRRALARASEQGARYADVGTVGAEGPGPRLLQAHGFQPVQTWMEMHCPPGAPLPAPTWPPSYQVRPYSTVGDPAVVADALNRGFSGHWENRERPLADIAQRLSRPHVRLDGILLAFGAAGDVAGICWASIDEERNAQRGEAVGHIDSLAVVPEHRRQGLGRALLLAGMAWLHAQDQAAIELDAIGDNVRALPLYYATGFVIKRQGAIYRRYL